MKGKREKKEKKREKRGKKKQKNKERRMETGRGESEGFQAHNAIFDRMSWVHMLKHYCTYHTYNIEHTMIENAPITRLGAPFVVWIATPDGKYDLSQECEFICHVIFVSWTALQKICSP